MHWKAMGPGVFNPIDFHCMEKKKNSWNILQNVFYLNFKWWSIPLKAYKTYEKCAVE